MQFGVQVTRTVYEPATSWDVKNLRTERNRENNQVKEEGEEGQEKE